VQAHANLRRGQIYFLADYVLKYISSFQHEETVKGMETKNPIDTAK
jgi:hypothetical protein